MVKSIIIIVVLFVSLIGLATYEVVSVDNIITSLETMVETLQVDISENKNNVNEVTESVKKVQTYWNEHEENLCLMFNHKDLSAITDTLTRLFSYVENNDYDNAIAEVNLLKKYSEKNRHIMGFNLQNLL